MVQLSHPYVTAERTIALTVWTFVSKVMSLLFNMLCRFVIAFLARSKHLLILWLQLPYAVILEPKRLKSVTVSLFPLVFSRQEYWNGLPFHSPQSLPDPGIKPVSPVFIIGRVESPGGYLQGLEIPRATTFHKLSNHKGVCSAWGV